MLKHEMISEAAGLETISPALCCPPPGRKNIKAFKAYIPPIELNAHAVVAEFIAQQESMLIYLRLANEVDLNSARIPISISRLIKLKLGDVLQFVIAHIDRHMLQAKKAKDKNFSKA